MIVVARLVGGRLGRVVAPLQTSRFATQFCKTCLHSVIAVWSLWLYRAPSVAHIECGSDPRFTRLFREYIAAAIVSLVLNAQKSSATRDYYQMFVHDVLTIALVYSVLHSTEQQYVAITAFILHDITDVMIGAAKLCNYVGWKRGAELWFVVTLVGWAYCRLYLFGRLLLNASCASIEWYLPPCMVLYALHWWWWSLLLHVCYRMTATGDGLGQATETLYANTGTKQQGALE